MKTSKTGQRAGNGSRYAAVNGIIYVALFLGGLIAVTAGNKAGGSYPTPWSSSSHIHTFYAAGHITSVVGGILQSLAAIALLAFSAVLAAHLSKLSFGKVPSRMVQAGGAAAGIFLLFSALCSWLLSRPEILQSTPTLRLVQDLSFASGGVAHVLALTLMIGVPSAIALGMGWLPRWLGVLGMVVTLAALLSVLALASESLSIFLPVARFGSFIWIAVVSVVLMRERTTLESRIDR